MHPNRQLERAIFDVLQGPVERLGYELVAVEYLLVGRRQTLRVTIDRPGGVGVDDCARVSRRIGPVLDVEDRLPGAYDLEVSSPGMNRPLQRAEDFRRYAGIRARLRVGGRRVTGRLAGLRDGVLRLETEQGPRDVPLATIERAHLAPTEEEFRRMGEGLPVGEAAAPPDHAKESP